MTTIVQHQFRSYGGAIRSCLALANTVILRARCPVDHSYFPTSSAGKTLTPISILHATGFPSRCAARNSHCARALRADCFLQDGPSTECKAPSLPFSSMIPVTNTGPEFAVRSVLGVVAWIFFSTTGGVSKPFSKPFWAGAELISVYCMGQSGPPPASVIGIYTV